MIDLNDKAQIHELDTHDMLETLARFPNQIQEAIELGQALDWTTGDISQVIVMGMGGSGIAGDLLKRFLNVPVTTCKGYELPPDIDSNSLWIAISYSGNTQETLYTLKKAITYKAPILCVTTGGHMKQIAQRHHLPLIKLPIGYPPRLALGYLAIPLLVWAERNGLSRMTDQWDLALLALKSLTERCCIDIPLESNPAKSLAQQLSGKIPLIYGTHANTAVIAQRWKCQINENAKQPAFWNEFPELNHNEIVQFTSSETFTQVLPHAVIVLLRNAFERREYIQRINTLKRVLKERVIAVIEVQSEDGDELAQVVSQIHLGDWMSAYLALSNGVDPTPITLIDHMKTGLIGQTY